MRSILFCLTVLLPLACDEYAPSDAAGGGTGSKTQNLAGASNGGANATEGGGNSSTGPVASASGGKSATPVSEARPHSSFGGDGNAGSGAAFGSSVAGGVSIGEAGNAGTASEPTMSQLNCGLPDVGVGGVPRPAGTAGGFKVIDWAGFKGAVSFTFDDGNSSQLDSYAALMKLGIRYTFFLIGQNVAQNVVNWQRAAADGNELGNHTQYHVQGDAIASDVGAGQKTVESTFNVKAYTMAAPYGNDYSSIAPSFHFLNRGTANGLMRPNADAVAFDTPCFIPGPGEKVAAFDAEINAARAGNGWKVILIHGFTGDSSAFNPVDLDQFTLAVEHAKAPGDLWIDTFANVGAYWRGQAALSKGQVTTSGVEQTWSWTLPAHFPPDKCLRVTVSGGTLKQNGRVLPWNEHGYYEIALDAGSVSLSQ